MLSEEKKIKFIKDLLNVFNRTLIELQEQIIFLRLGYSVLKTFEIS